MRRALSCLLVALLSLSNAHRLPYAPVNGNMKSFSSAIKGGNLPANKEYTLYEHTTGPGVITEQWFTGAFSDTTRIRIYFDGETTPGLDFQLYLAHGIGFDKATEDKYTPWGTKRLGHAASNGGLYNTYRIPYAKSFKLTATDPKGGVFWYIIRGVENYPTVIGDVQLPAGAQLKLYKNVAVKLQPYQFLTLANVTSSAGMIYQVTIAATSTDFNYLEACVRFAADGAPAQFLSSGTEDFFLSAYYYDRGIYHHDNAGLTHKGPPDSSMSAYKFFENDPLFFTKSAVLMWRNCEKANGVDGCPNAFPPPHEEMLKNVGNISVAEATATTYTWVYQW